MPSRAILALVTAVLLVVAGIFAPATAGRAVAASSTKVVIVVGPVGDSQTAKYIVDANAAAAVARKYTSNVTTIYSPHATWARVKAAIQGANVVLYLGHGNGFPSPYSSTINKNSMDGFGLNAADNAGNYNWAYYGENYVKQVALAPNSAVLFSRLCYASGDNEWGKGIPTLAVAKQRVDNYASAFLSAGARAVIADGLGDIGWYISALFTRHSTIDSLFKASPDGHKNYVTYASSRNAGFTSILDVGTYSGVPDKDPYYRSMVSVPTLATDTIVGTTAAPAKTALSGKTQVAVNLRTAPSTSAKIVKTLPAGTTFVVRAAMTADSAGRSWAPIKTSTGLVGYIASAYAAFGGSATANVALNVRKGASTGAAVVAVVAKGTRFTVVASWADSLKRTWFAVKLSTGVTGYVAAWLTAP